MDIMNISIKKYAKMKLKLLTVLVLVTFVAALTIQVVNAEANYVSGSISSTSSTIVVHQSVTFTCTYTSTLGVQGYGTLEMSGPAATSANSGFKTWSEISSWDTIDSGVPVTHTQTLDSPGYYRVRWLCSGGGVDGAFTYVTIHVLDMTVLPETPPLAGIAASIAAIGVGIAVVKKKSTAVNTNLP